MLQLTNSELILWGRLHMLWMFPMEKRTRLRACAWTEVLSKPLLALQRPCQCLPVPLHSGVSRTAIYLDRYLDYPFKSSGKGEPQIALGKHTSITKFNNLNACINIFFPII